MLLFKIYDGRNSFYQWDVNRKLIVNDKTINQVHFCNKTTNCSLVKDVYDTDNLRLVDVPNILLEENWRITVYGYDSEYTKHCMTFEVVARSKPENYVYYDEELKTWKELEERIAELEENGGGNSAAGVPVYYKTVDLPTDAAADSLAYVKVDSGLNDEFDKVELKAAGDYETATKLPNMYIRVATEPPQYNETEFRLYADSLASYGTMAGMEFDLNTNINKEIYSGYELEVTINVMMSSMNKYDSSINWDDHIIPAIESDADYCLIVNFGNPVFVDHDMNITNDYYNGDCMMIQQYFYFFGDGYVYADIGMEKPLDIRFTKGWYAWVMTSSNNDTSFDTIDVIPVDYPKYAYIETSETGYGKYENDSSKAILDGIFESPKKAGFYLNHNNEWVKVVDGRGV